MLKSDVKYRFSRYVVIETGGLTGADWSAHNSHASYATLAREFSAQAEEPRRRGGVAGRGSQPLRKALVHGALLMTDDAFPSAVRIGRPPLYPLVAPYAGACFVGALVTDLAYWRTANVIWETFSVWLLTAGLVMAALAVVVGLIDWIGGRGIVGLTSVWPRLLGRALVVFLSLVNAFVHSRDGYTAVVPQGLILSGLVVIIMAFVGWMGLAYVHRRRIGMVH
jgi:uncharacterized membrane protein